MFSVFFLCLLTGPLHAADFTPVTRAVDDFVNSGKLAGLSVLIKHGDDEEFYIERGYADIERQRLLRRDSIFRIYSNTKALTSAAALMLWEEGHYDLHDPVTRYLPELATLRVYAGENEDGSLRTVPLERPPTIRELFTHSAGFAYGLRDDHPVDRAYRELDIFNRGTLDLEALLDLLISVPLRSQPGEEWYYSLSIDILGRLIEVWSGQPLDTFLAERLLVPLGMSDTGFHVPADKLSRVATVYSPDQTGKLVPGDLRPWDVAVPPALLSGGGGLLSTIDDYMKFLSMIAADGTTVNGTRLLQPRTVDMMRMNQLSRTVMQGPVINSAGGEYGHGLGFAVLLDPGALGIDTSPGEYFWGGAADTLYWLDPERDLIVVAMTQHWTTGERVPLRDTLRSAVSEARGER
ncbi:MAG TPA: serine hydrolase domain-containing protein [Kineobactrum sp.]